MAEDRYLTPLGRQIGEQHERREARHGNAPSLLGTVLAANLIGSVAGRLAAPGAPRHPSPEACQPPALPLGARWQCRTCGEWWWHECQPPVLPAGVDWCCECGQRFAGPGAAALPVADPTLTASDFADAECYACGAKYPHVTITPVREASGGLRGIGHCTSCGEHDENVQLDG